MRSRALKVAERTIPDQAPLEDSGLHMAVVNPPLWGPRGANLTSELQLVKACLLYGDTIELYSLGATLYSQLPANAEHPGRFVEYLASQDPQTLPGPRAARYGHNPLVRCTQEIAVQNRGGTRARLSLDPPMWFVVIG